MSDDKVQAMYGIQVFPQNPRVAGAHPLWEIGDWVVPVLCTGGDGLCH